MIRRVLSVLVLSLALVPVPVGQAAEPDSVNVFFSRDPDSFNDFTAVFPLPRTVPGGTGVIEQTVEAQLLGPTAAEQGAGYFSDSKICWSARRCVKVAISS